jgi:uncharacterized membrane protein YdjX (TVP38/TMEM64 family)
MPTRLRVWDERIAGGGLPQVVLLRVVTGQFTPADWLLGVSTVRLRVFAIGTAIGIIPGIVLATTLGGGIVDLLGNRSLRLPLVVLAVSFAVFRRVRRLRRSRRTRASAPRTA